MFGFFKQKKQEERKSSIQLWLETADDAYEQACARRLTSGLAHFFEGTALRYLMQKISHLTEDEDGLSSFRHTVFRKVKTKDNKLKYRRDVTFDDIHISRMVSIPLGTPYSEKWTLTDDENNEKRVCNIERCEDKLHESKGDK